MSNNNSILNNPIIVSIVTSIIITFIFILCFYFIILSPKYASIDAEIQTITINNQKNTEVTLNNNSGSVIWKFSLDNNNNLLIGNPNPFAIVDKNSTNISTYTQQQASTTK